ncbi:MAG: gliding motility-associated ABC transporter permease subunit GldF [Chitinophagaceae bacterium]
MHRYSSHMLAIFKKEINQFFSNITGYVAIILFLTVNGLLLFVFPDTNLLADGYASLNKFFSWGPWIFLLLIPAVTMRIFSEEFRSGTMEWLGTQPLTNLQLILGKYLACVFLIFFSLLPTLFYYYTIFQLSASGGGPDNGSILGSYIGLFLLGSVYSSIGVWTSSVSNNSVVAFLLAVFLCSVFYSGFDAISKLPVFVGTLDFYIQMLGIQFHYSSISRGVLDTRDLIYYLSIIIIFLLFTSLSLNRRKGE